MSTDAPDLDAMLAAETAARDREVRSALQQLGKLEATHIAAKLLNESFSSFMQGLSLAVTPPDHSDILASGDYDAEDEIEFRDPVTHWLQVACYYGPQIRPDMERLDPLITADDVWPRFSRATPFPTEENSASYHAEMLRSVIFPFWGFCHAIEDNAPRERGSVEDLTPLDIADHYEELHASVERFEFEPLHIFEMRLYKECERAGVDMLALHQHEHGVNSGIGPARICMPGDLPVVTLGRASATIVFAGKIFADVDLKAGEALKLICDRYPVPVGITNACNGKAMRVIDRLPEGVREHVYSVPGNKGYSFRM